MDPYANQSGVPSAGQAVNPFDSRSGPYKFTADEVRVFKECNRESFYQRSLPIGTLLGFGTFYATKAGFLKPSAKWGAVPKVSLAVILGYFVGKISYQQKCMEKIMKLPNSPLADSLRKRKQKLGDSFLYDAGLGIGPMPSPGLVTESFQTYSDHGPRSTTELDFSRPLMSLDSTDSKSMDDSYLMEEPLPAATRNTTYEDLRAQNRDEYEKKRLAQNRGLMQQSDAVAQAAPRNPLPNPIGEQTNEYGDTWIR
ncbi:OCIA domain-containing protein 1 [Neocloeon triangulifer]|uniref:OCIA domain-containing protein 1 n=1 Tax=Neocloeon triangulifer TaxID=2078957 RepID=UPI00286F6591|nr:OCIA domain-containing protein 1 [Neocloeon triangulifer]